MGNTGKKEYSAVDTGRVTVKRRSCANFRNWAPHYPKTINVTVGEVIKFTTCVHDVTAPLDASFADINSALQATRRIHFVVGGTSHAVIDLDTPIHAALKENTRLLVGNDCCVYHLVPSAKDTPPLEDEKTDPTPIRPEPPSDDKKPEFDLVFPKLSRDDIWHLTGQSELVEILRNFHVITLLPTMPSDIERRSAKCDDARLFGCLQWIKRFQRVLMDAAPKFKCQHTVFPNLATYFNKLDKYIGWPRDKVTDEMRKFMLTLIRHGFELMEKTRDGWKSLCLYDPTGRVESIQARVF
ncbi:MAG: hypothetical protein KGL39_18785 [Patescibacteria group bacterium]|nr:hypothetical protein [Patescibacteria group bacterium]